MKMSERKRMAKKTPSQLARIRKRKTKAVAKRATAEQQMVEYLLDRGWSRSGPLGDVWKTSHWKPYRELLRSRKGYMQVGETDFVQRIFFETEQKQFSSENAAMTLHRAYEYQKRLDASGYERPKGVDDDLAADI